MAWSRQDFPSSRRDSSVRGGSLSSLGALGCFDGPGTGKVGDGKGGKRELCGRERKLLRAAKNGVNVKNRIYK